MKATSSLAAFVPQVAAIGESPRQRILPTVAIVAVAFLASMPWAAASTIWLSSGSPSSMPFTMNGTVSDVVTGRSGTMQSSGVIITEDLSSVGKPNQYRITTSSTFQKNISPPLANSVVTGIIDKIIRDFAPKPNPPVPPVPPPSDRPTVAQITNNDFQLSFTANAPLIVTMTGTVTATPTLWDFGFSVGLLQSLPDFTDEVDVALEAEGILAAVGPGRSGPGTGGWSARPGLFSGSTAPTLNASEAVSLTLTPIGGSPLDLTLDIDVYWSLDYGVFPNNAQKFTVSSTITNTPAVWSSNGGTIVSGVPEIDPVSLGGTLGVVASFLALLEGRQRRHRPRSWGRSLGVGSPVAELAAQPGLREPEPALGRLP